MPNPDAQASVLVDVQHLTKRYGRLTALNDVSFSIRPGEVLGLIGPNGSGKTTLFECVGGVLPMDEGAILHDGCLLSSRERSAFLFYLPDAIAPWPEQPVRWALDFTVGLFGGRKELRDDVVRRLDSRPPPPRCPRGRSRPCAATASGPSPPQASWPPPDGAT